MFIKILEENKDLHLALLMYRNTPITDNVSPAEILMSRKLRNILPCTTNSLKQKIVKKYDRNIKKAQVQQQNYYNYKGIRELKPLSVNSRVYLQKKLGSTWTPGVIVEKVRKRTYKIKLDNGSILTRNRRFIKHVNGSNSNNNKSNVKINPAPISKKEDVDRDRKCYIELDNSVSNSESEERENSVETAEENSQDVDSELESSFSDSLDTKASETEGSDSEERFMKQEKITSSGRISKGPPRLNL